MRRAYQAIATITLVSVGVEALAERRYGEVAIWAEAALCGVLALALLVCMAIERRKGRP